MMSCLSASPKYMSERSNRAIGGIQKTSRMLTGVRDGLIIRVKEIGRGKKANEGKTARSR